MQTILVANPKGGSGKTTLATNIAGWLAGKRQRVGLQDADPQGSATQWLSRRPSLFPSIAGFAADAGKKEMRDVGIEWLVVDSAAGTRGEALRDAVRRADAMIVPVSPSVFDMAATADFLKAIARVQGRPRRGLAVGLVAMRVDARTRAAGELDEFLEQFDFPRRHAPARHAGLRVLRARRLLGVRLAALTRRAGLGAVAAADAVAGEARCRSRQLK